MMSTFGSRRRAMFQVLAAVAGVVISDPSVGNSNDQPEEEVSHKSAKDQPADTSGKSKASVLIVVVVGAGKPVEHAQVKVTFSAVPKEAIRETDGTGMATFEGAKLGTAKVRVIAAGWASALLDVKIKPGEQRVTVKLDSLLH